jgi:LysR family transcriptional regulator of gallate degradation
MIPQKAGLPDNENMRKAPSLAIRQVRTINAVATDASLAHACEHLNTSQSSLSRYIAEAERALGQRLFQRGWTGMEPTSQGEVVIAHCRRMVASIETAQSELRASGARVPDLSHYLRPPTPCVRPGASPRRQNTWGNPSRTSAAFSQRYRPPLAVSRFVAPRTGMEATKDALILSDLRGKLALSPTKPSKRMHRLGRG